MPGPDRLAKSDVRQRRAFQRLSKGLFTFGNGIQFDEDSQTISIDIATNMGLTFISGELAVMVGDGLELTSNGIILDLLASGGLEITSGELNIADTIDLSVVGSSGVVTFLSSTAAHGVISGAVFIGNDPTTASTAILSHSSHTATPAISQNTDGAVFIESASGEEIRINPAGAAGTYIGQTSLASNVTASGSGSTIIGGTDATGTLLASGQNDVVVGAATTGGDISSTSSFFSFALGFATSSGTIVATNFASLAYGLCLGSTSVITSSGFGSVCGGLAGAGFPVTSTVSGSGSFGWGGGHSIAGASCGAFGRSHTINVQSGFARGESHVVSGVYGDASGFGADARLRASKVLAGYSENVAGDGQQLEICLYADTSDATPTVMTIDNASGRLTIQEDSVVSFNILVVGKELASGGQRAAYQIRGCIYRDTTAASTTVAGAATVVLLETTGTMDAVVTADTTNGALTLTVTGVAATDMRWTAAVRMAEVVAGA